MKRLLLALLVAACAVFAGCAQLLPTEYTQMTEDTEQPAAPASKSDVGDTRVFDQVKFGKDYEIE